MHVQLMLQVLIGLLLMSKLLTNGFVVLGNVSISTQTSTV